MCEIPAKNLSMVAAACDVSRPALRRWRSAPTRRKQCSKRSRRLGRQLAQEGVERLETEVRILALAMLARRHALSFHFLVAHHQRVGHLHELRVADLRAQLLRGLVQLDA